MRAGLQVDSQAPSPLDDDGGRAVEVRGEIIEIRCGQFHQFPIILHGPWGSTTLADHRDGSQTVPIDRRVLQSPFDDFGPQFIGVLPNRRPARHPELEGLVPRYLIANVVVISQQILVIQIHERHDTRPQLDQLISSSPQPIQPQSVAESKPVDLPTASSFHVRIMPGELGASRTARPGGQPRLTKREFS